MKFLFKCIAFILGISLLFIACATNKEFRDKEASSSSKIRAAAESGANEVPSAAFYLRLAKEEIEQAKNTNNKKEAASLLERAEIDAELAAALAEEDSEKKEAAEEKARVHQLKLDNEIPASERTQP